MISITLPGSVVFFILLACILIPWFFLGKFLLRKLDEYIIPRIENRYSQDEESS